MSRPKKDATPPVELTDVDKFYIGANLNEHPENLARKIKKPVYLVTRFIEEMNPKTEKYEPSRIMNLMVTKTVGGKSGVTMMTAGASEAGQEGDNRRATLRAKINQAIERGDIIEANNLQTELNGLAPEQKESDRYKDCVGPARREIK